ncbi:unnamed protein product [Amoebophrya sp. A25]|nr:unnamed protein product [Amoebophrya sp. A25]|eukprot:GSA25T00017702001.1
MLFPGSSNASASCSVSASSAEEGSFSTVDIDDADRARDIRLGAGFHMPAASRKSVSSGRSSGSRKSTFVSGASYGMNYLRNMYEETDYNNTTGGNGNLRAAQDQEANMTNKVFASTLYPPASDYEGEYDFRAGPLTSGECQREAELGRRMMSSFAATSSDVDPNHIIPSHSTSTSSPNNNKDEQKILHLAGGGKNDTETNEAEAPISKTHEYPNANLLLRDVTSSEDSLEDVDQLPRQQEHGGHTHSGSAGHDGRKQASKGSSSSPQQEDGHGSPFGGAGRRATRGILSGRGSSNGSTIPRKSPNLVSSSRGVTSSSSGVSSPPDQERNTFSPSGFDMPTNTLLASPISPIAEDKQLGLGTMVKQKDADITGSPNPLGVGDVGVVLSTTGPNAAFPVRSAEGFAASGGASPSLIRGEDLLLWPNHESHHCDKEVQGQAATFEQRLASAAMSLELTGLSDDEEDRLDDTNINNRDPVLLDLERDHEGDGEETPRAEPLVDRSNGKSNGLVRNGDVAGGRCLTNNYGNQGNGNGSKNGNQVTGTMMTTNVNATTTSKSNYKNGQGTTRRTSSNINSKPKTSKNSTPSSSPPLHQPFLDHSDGNPYLRRCFLQIFAALNYCHRLQVVHRDLKPQNCLIKGSYVKLVDFGLAAIEEGRDLHRIVGTPYYMPPEVCDIKVAQETGYSEKCDIWSAGVMLYVLYTREHPFLTRETQEKKWPRKFFHRVKTEPPHKLPLEEKLSPACRDLCLWMLQKDAAKRPSAEQILRHPWCRLPRTRITPEMRIALRRLVPHCRKPKLVRTLQLLAAREAADVQIATARALFERVDTGKNGLLNKENVRRAFERLLKEPISDDDLDLLFDQLDLRVGFEEYHCRLLGYTQFLAATMSPAVLGQDAVIDRVFEYFDLDNSGHIQGPELRTMLGDDADPEEMTLQAQGGGPDAVNDGQQQNAIDAQLRSLVYSVDQEVSITRTLFRQFCKELGLRETAKDRLSAIGLTGGHQ